MPQQQNNNEERQLNKIYVTHHAFVRWRQRVSSKPRTHSETYSDITQAVRESRIIRKDEPLPYPVARIKENIYRLNGNVLFVINSISEDSCRLLTIINEFTEVEQKSLPEPPVPEHIQYQRQKSKLLKEISNLPRSDPLRTKLNEELDALEDKEQLRIKQHKANKNQLRQQKRKS